MLPTDDNNAYVIYHKDGHYVKPQERVHQQAIYNGYTRNYIYITIDDKITVGDWYLWFDLPKIAQVGHIQSGQKIIATTDPELNKGWIEDLDPERKSTHTQLVTHQGLPQPSKAFIEEYCRAGGIDEVDVEYGLFHDGNFKDDDETHAFKAIRKPKVTSNNEIIIHPIEEKMYSESELIQFILDNRFRIDSNTTREEIINLIKRES